MARKTVSVNFWVRTSEPNTFEGSSQSRAKNRVCEFSCVNRWASHLRKFFPVSRKTLLAAILECEPASLSPPY